MIIYNNTQKTQIAEKAKIADNFFSRLKGLLGTDSLEKGAALVIRPCNSVHTIGMKYPIDVLFLDKYDKVVKIVSNLQSSKFAFCGKASYVIELPSGTVQKSGTIGGDMIAFS
ncbi:MAG: DUF192 domain-containing protein [Acholeplasmataceae bacterium]|nr:DUF192 domain-containing protein [Acholeplasmataceae bacterium]